jgi:hypothetical protein
MKKFTQDTALPIVQDEFSVPMDCSSLFGPSPIFLIVLGTFSATYLPQLSVDGETWVDGHVQCFDLAAGTALAGGLTTTGSQFYLKTYFPFVRFKCTTFASASSTDPPHVHLVGQDSRST